MTRLDILLKLLNENPDDEFTHFAIAKEYEKMGHFENAESFYLKLLNLNQDYVGAYYHIANLYASDGQYSNAIKFFNKGIEIAQKLKDAHALSELKAAKLNLEIENL